MTNFKENYKIDFDTEQEILQHFFASKNDPQYKVQTYQAMQNLIGLFKHFYPDVAIQDPIFREKSVKSGLFKLKELQIERFAKLYSLHLATNLDTNNFIQRITDRIHKCIPPPEQEHIIQSIQILLFSDLRTISIRNLANTLMSSHLSIDNRRALLRILYQRILDSNLSNISEELTYIEKNYGAIGAILQQKPENDILHYTSITKLKNRPDLIANLQDEKKFVRCHDLKGSTIVISHIPANFTTKNEPLKQLLKKREEATTPSSYKELDHQCMVLLSEEFANKLCQIKEYRNLCIIPDSLKHKNKSNGYEAYHMEFLLQNHPDYFLELQVKSKYIEEISRGNGSASHSKRFSKERVLPPMDTIQGFKNTLAYILPHYVEFQSCNGYAPYEFSMEENTLKYLFDILKDDHTATLKIHSFFKQLEEQEK